MASAPEVLWAVKTRLNVPLTVGVPLRTPVAAVNVTPLGRAPDSDRVGVGKPVAVTVNEPRVLIVNVVLLALVMAGAAAAGLTVRVKF